MIDLKTIEEINEDISNINNPLEEIKVASALNSELFKMNYRKINNPKELSVLDYSIIVALDRQLGKELLATEKYLDGCCPECRSPIEWIVNEHSINLKYCPYCGQKIKRN